MADTTKELSLALRNSSLGYLDSKTYGYGPFFAKIIDYSIQTSWTIGIKISKLALCLIFIIEK